MIARLRHTHRITFLVATLLILLILFFGMRMKPHYPAEPWVPPAVGRAATDSSIAPTPRRTGTQSVSLPNSPPSESTRSQN